MPPVTILSPYSGRPVKIREHDLGRALRDEQGRVFYVVEDPEHGRYAARTRKGSDKDLQRYRQIESGVAKLEDGPTLSEAQVQQAHDATGKTRRNPVGLLAMLVIIALVAAAGYVYLNHPEWLGIETPAPAEDTQEVDAEESGQSSSDSTHYEIQEVAQQTTSDPLIKNSQDPRAPGLAAAPLPAIPSNELDHVADDDRPALPDGMDYDPEPVFVAAQSLPDPIDEPTDKPAARPTPPTTTETVPIVLAAMQPAPTDYDDFHHTASGLRYKITHLSDGVSARAGNYLTVRYTAQTLDGKPLINDASQSFTLARGQAIRALDEGLAGIREGEQLRMLVPRGHSDQGSLPGINRIPDEPFLLDVQLVSVRPGVTFIIESPGDIDRPACTPGDTIDLHYLARVEGRDEVIDATVHRGQPMRFTLGNNEVIKGLDIGITGMRPGESRQLTIPPYLAYGKYSVAGGLIPENAVLSFRVTLVQVVEDQE
ncbi:MAG: FKBP-type peptidyl-prolyl cis-trans isomerase [Phycisphaeraceae bacterium]